jgi:hypothetical protein
MVSIAVSKTEGPGSSPGTPAKLTGTAGKLIRKVLLPNRQGRPRGQSSSHHIDSCHLTKPGKMTRPGKTSIRLESALVRPLTTPLTMDKL